MASIPFHECWDWEGSVDSKGYGQLQLDHITRKKTGAHRVSWTIHFGEIPEGFVVRHKCDNPICARPEHLELGTQSDNMQDASKRGRLNTWASKVTHCPQGHEYDEKNTEVRYKKNGRTARRCRACRRKTATYRKG